MPFSSTPGCVLGDCGAPSFPQLQGNCICETALGGIAELYHIPCTQVMSEENVTDPAWWQAMITAETLGRSGALLGSIAKGATTTDRVASCLPEQITGVTWNLTSQKKCFDKTSARTTQAQADEAWLNSSKYLLIARMCDGDEDVLPIGKYTITDLDWTVADNSDENQILQLVYSWKQKSFPTPTTVAGLALILPKP